MRDGGSAGGTAKEHGLVAESSVLAERRLDVYIGLRLHVTYAVACGVQWRDMCDGVAYAMACRVQWLHVHVA